MFDFDNLDHGGVGQCVGHSGVTAVQHGCGGLLGDVHFADIVDGGAIHIDPHPTTTIAGKLVRLGEDGLQVRVKRVTQAQGGRQFDFVTVHMRFSFKQRIGFFAIIMRQPHQ